jgi:MFS family permease
VARPFGFATGLAVLTTGAYALVPLFWPLLLARMLWGIAWSLLRMGAYLVIIEDAPPSRRARLFGVFNGLARAGSLVSVIAGGVLVDRFGFRATVLVFSAATLLSVALAVVVARTQAATVDATRPGGQGASRQGEAVCSPLAVILCGFAYSVVLNGVITSTIGLLLAQRIGTIGAVTTVAGLVIAMRWLSDVGLAPVAGLVSDKLGRRRALPALSLTTACLVLAMVAPVPLWLTIGVTALVFFLGTAMHVNGEAAAGDLAVAQGSNHILGRYATVIDLGAAVGPLGALPLIELVGLGSVYTASAVFLGIAGMLAIPWRPVAVQRPA